MANPRYRGRILQSMVPSSLGKILSSGEGDSGAMPDVGNNKEGKNYGFNKRIYDG